MQGPVETLLQLVLDLPVVLVDVNQVREREDTDDCDSNNDDGRD